MVEFFLGLFLGISICLGAVFGYGIYVIKKKEETAYNIISSMIDYDDIINHEIRKYKS